MIQLRRGLSLTQFKHLTPVIRSGLFEIKLTMSTIQYLQTDSGEKLAYEKIPGSSDYPTLLYVPGYGSGKDGDKAKFLKEIAEEVGCAFVRYDPVSLGDSVNDKAFSSMEFEDWLNNAESMLKFVQQDCERIVLVGNSMGGWISIKLAAQFSQSVKGMVLISPAFNYFRKFYPVICSQLPKDAVERVEAGETYDFVDADGYSRPIRKSFFMNTEKFEMHGSLDIEVPVIILHGIKDETIPYKESLNIIENLTSKDVELTYVKEATHRFLDPPSLEIIKDRVLKMLEKTKS